VNESMVGAKNQPPSGFNPAFVSSASARWETLEQRLERSIREDQALVTKLPWQDALKRIYQSATDVELKALGAQVAGRGPSPSNGRQDHHRDGSEQLHLHRGARPGEVGRARPRGGCPGHPAQRPSVAG